MPRQCRGWLDMIVIMFNVMRIRVYYWLPPVCESERVGRVLIATQLMQQDE